MSSTPIGQRVPALLRSCEVARLLGISSRTACLWAECSQLPAIKVGRQWRFSREALTIYLNNLPTNDPTILAAWGVSGTRSRADHST